MLSLLLFPSIPSNIWDRKKGRGKTREKQRRAKFPLFRLRNLYRDNVCWIKQPPFQREQHRAMHCAPRPGQLHVLAGPWGCPGVLPRHTASTVYSRPVCSSFSTPSRGNSIFELQDSRTTEQHPRQVELLTKWLLPLYSLSHLWIHSSKHCDFTYSQLTHTLHIFMGGACHVSICVYILECSMRACIPMSLNGYLRFML